MGDREAGTREKGGRWEETERDVRDHARAGGARRIRDIKIFNDFLVSFSLFLRKLSKIRTKEYRLFTILTGIKLYRQS